MASKFIQQLTLSPAKIEFSSVIEFIANNFDYTPAKFMNGIGENAVVNEAGENEGSCKIFALGRLLQLDKISTLACFGAYYRDDVLGNPNGDDHANIRAFMKYGWEGINFDSDALVAK